MIEYDDEILIMMMRECPWKKMQNLPQQEQKQQKQ